LSTHAVAGAITLQLLRQTVQAYRQRTQRWTAKTGQKTVLNKLKSCWIFFLSVDRLHPTRYTELSGEVEAGSAEEQPAKE